MTLIACLHPRKSRTLLADILISSDARDRRDIVVPIRAYVAPHRLQLMSWTPAAFSRKVIEVTPELVILWAGSYSKACQLARRARDWLKANQANADDVLPLLYQHYREASPDFQAIITPAAEDWMYIIGNVKRGKSALGGEYAVAGTGAEAFQTVMDGAYLPEGDTVTPEATALSFSSALLAREILTSEPIYSGFGGGYEVIYRGDAKFIRIDDLMYVFVRVDISKPEPEVWLESPFIRQWYEEDCLYIVSLSLTEHARQGLESRGFVIPSVLGQSHMPKRAIEDLATTQPKYLCIHELFYNQRAMQPIQFALKGISIDEYFTISPDGFQFTPSYMERLHSLSKTVNETPGMN